MIIIVLQATQSFRKLSAGDPLTERLQSVVLSAPGACPLGYSHGRFESRPFTSHVIRAASARRRCTIWLLVGRWLGRTVGLRVFVVGSGADAFADRAEGRQFVVGQCVEQHVPHRVNVSRRGSPDRSYACFAELHDGAACVGVAAAAPYQSALFHTSNVVGKAAAVPACRSTQIADPQPMPGASDSGTSSAKSAAESPEAASWRSMARSRSRRILRSARQVCCSAPRNQTTSPIPNPWYASC